MQRVLIIDAQPAWQKYYQKELPATVEIVAATSTDDAVAIIAEIRSKQAQFHAVVVDLAPGQELEGTKLAFQLMRAGLGHLMVVTSFNPELQSAGCREAIRKEDVIAKIKEVLESAN